VKLSDLNYKIYVEGVRKISWWGDFYA
jgi:hypothetical protein